MFEHFKGYFGYIERFSFTYIATFVAFSSKYSRIWYKFDALASVEFDVGLSCFFCWRSLIFTICFFGCVKYGVDKER